MAIQNESFATSATKNPIYREQLITKEDLNEFRTLLLTDLKAILIDAPKKNKQWLKSGEVRKILNISPGTLQTLRINKTLSYTKIGGILYYANSDLEKLLEHNKVQAVQTLFK